MNPKKTKVFATISIAAAMMMGTCSGALVAFAEEDSEPIYLGDVTIAVDEDFGDCNILHQTSESNSSLWIYTMIYDRLFELDDDGEFQPSLALSWSYIGNGGESYTVNDIEFPDMPEEWEWQMPGWDYVYCPDPCDMTAYDSNSPMIVELELNTEIMFSDGEWLTSTLIADYITYAKTLTGTLICEQWAPVVASYVVDDTILQLKLDFSSCTYGFIDFLYSLTTPIASIVHVTDYENIPAGTGAYNIAPYSESNELTLNPNEFWQLGTPYTNSVTFKYLPTAAERESALTNGFVDISVVDYSSYGTLSEFGCYSFKNVTENFVGLKFNMTSINGGVQNKDFRRTLLKCIDLAEIQSNLGLEASSWDYWCYYNQGTGEDERTEARDALSAEYYGEKINILLQDDTYRSYLNSAFSDCGLTVNIYTATSEADYQSKCNSSTYDIVVGEIDLNNINSAYVTLYDNCIDSDLDYMLALAKNAGDVDTYKYIEAEIQIQIYKQAYVYNLGWQTKICNICVKNL